MGKVVQIPLDDLEGRLVCPPIIDLLHYEPSLDAYMATFVPSEYVSAQPTETAVIRRAGPTAREFQRIDHALRQLAERLGRGRAIQRIVHGGGGDFTVHFAEGDARSLSDDAIEPSLTLWAVLRMQDIAQAAEIGYVLLSRPAA